jgi:UDP-2,3-diacylglucosamine pyrophosphatase LpxH
LKLEHEYLRSVALVSDMHVGSVFGLCPERYVSGVGGEVSKAMNAGQKQLLESWKDYVVRMKKFKVDTVFLVGDIFAGVNFAENGLHLITADMNEQLEMACELLKPLVGGTKVCVWSGTPFHDSRDFRIHKVLAEYLNGKFYGAVANVKLDGVDKIVNVAHATTDAIVYPETVLSRDIMFLKEAEALGKLPKINAVIRAHRHSYVEIHKHDLHYISLPCWEAFTPYYKAVKWYFKFQPDIGGAVMLADDQKRLRFMHFLYDCPHISDKVVNC